MILKQNGKVARWEMLKRTWKEDPGIGDLALKEVGLRFRSCVGLRFRLYIEKKSRQLVAWTPDKNVKMRDIVISNDTIRSATLIEEGKEVDDYAGNLLRLSYPTNIYKIEILISNELAPDNQPTVMHWTLSVIQFWKDMFCWYYVSLPTE